ncbi:MAG: DMT family transporter [Clostridia bacterium]|nr:DMT family transporter [Clostridia bacterium]
MKNTNTKGSLILLLTTLIWGTTFVAQDTAMAFIGPYAFQFSRSIIGSLVLVPVILLANAHQKKLPTYQPPTKKDRLTLLLGGAVCGFFLCIASCFQQVGIAMGTSGGKAGFITAMYIFFVPILGLFLRKKVPLRIWLCIALAGVGLYLLCLDGESGGFVPSDLVVLGCGIVFALQILAVDHFAARVDCLKLSSLQFLFSGLFSAIPMLIFEGAGELVNVPLALWQILFAGVLSCGVAYTLQTIGQKYTEPAIASLIMSFEAFFATIAGVFFLPDGMLSAREFIGCGVMLVAIILSQINFTKKQI